ncbi:zinc finger protein 364 [Lentinula edodes]|uniref:Zinc finger protein 364 n=1 Tax=Lentinula edodes TaxID=5353 RepID=A0A1Q3EDV6_LENED|nr:zinc finger protein 364 [Lentinula edodes]
MSSREPMWYCHQCNAEMRPLMVPDPICASCHGDFVEKIEDPDDDPREFQHGDPMDDAGIDPFLMVLQGLMNRGMPEQRSRPSSPRHNRSPSGNSSSSFSFQIRSGSGGPAVFSIGGPNTLGGTRAGSEPSGRPSNLADFIQSGDERAPGIADFLGGLGDAAERGRMGDYVFNQEALDQIISNLMENSNASRPVPATDEIMDKLPREVLEAGSKTLEKDCAVCKEQFQLQTEDPDEQIVITLPCGHPFHSSWYVPRVSLHSHGLMTELQYTSLVKIFRHLSSLQTSVNSSARTSCFAA